MNWDILYRYMRNDCSGEEIKQLQHWLQKNPANEDFFKTFIESWEEKKPHEPESDAQNAWKEFKKTHLKKIKADYSHIHKTLNKNPPLLSKNVKISRKGRLLWLYTTTAIIILVITIIAVINQSQSKAKKEAPDISYRTIYTKKGQRTNLRLKDGTQIILNAESKLRLPNQYGTISRTLYLQGEAFFKVVHNSKLPFMVISNKKYVKDLGTEFNLTAYDSSDIEVAVKKGLVSLGKIKKGNPQRAIGKIHKNNLAILGDKGELSISPIDNMSLFSGWAQGKLVFHNTSFPEVVKRLERWFNIKAKIIDPALNKRTLTATYDNMPFDELLHVLSLSLHISYKHKQNTIEFFNKNNLN